MDREVKFEALSALVQTKVRPVDKAAGEPPMKLLSPDDFLIAAIRIDTVFPGVSPLVKWFDKRFSGGSTFPSYEQENSGLCDVLQDQSGHTGGFTEQDSAHSSTPAVEKQEGLCCGSSLRYAKELFIDEEEFFDPEYDYDFTYRCDSNDECKRGGEEYQRPWGWYRMALKVWDKYSDGTTWLGPGGWRNESAPGEWPVSYHGTSLQGAKGIIKTNYKAGDRAVYGRGIYSTPKLPETDMYMTTFTSEKTNKTYRVVMQNRINSEKRERCDYEDYWLIPVPKDTSIEEERRIVECSIRPYGILIQELGAE